MEEIELKIQQLLRSLEETEQQRDHWHGADEERYQQLNTRVKELRAELAKLFKQQQVDWTADAEATS
ncbi:hypothetical protein [Dongshaea marina]|uniref:hypothetical protein n=1 Tax=Dongshaea marina TaxID=2047966 RepID=UPI000D3E4DA1|nr:hypothetical protein [Dongshaea marina]